MAYTGLLATIDAVIKTNGVGAITGADHQGVLHNVVSSLGSGYRYMGIATAATDPANPDDNQFYLANEAGVYTNFSGIELAADEVAFISGSGTTWSKDVLINGNDKNALAEFQAQAIGVENNFRSTVINDGGTYYANAGAKTIADLMADGLYKKTNLILTPAATKAGTGAGDGVLYSLKGDNFTVARNSKKSRVDVDGYIRQVGLDEATIDYSNGKAAIKLDPQSTNKILYPFSIENAYWALVGASVDTNAGAFYASPFKDTAGNVLNVARKLVEDTSTGLHRVYKSGISVTSGATVTSSFIVKPNGRNWVAMYEAQAGTAGKYFDILNCVAGSDYGGAAPDSYSIEKLADGYCRISITTTVTSTSANSMLVLANGDGVISYTGDSTSGIYLAGIQLKEGEPTSFINDPEDVEGSEVARLADDEYVTVPVGVTKITETFADGTTNVITTIPATYTLTNGQEYDNVKFE